MGKPLLASRNFSVPTAAPVAHSFFLCLLIQRRKRRSFVWSKRCAVWLWFAVCRRTRQIVGWLVGKRREVDCKAFRETIEPGYRDCQTRSDKLKHYAKIFGEKHQSVGKEETTRVEQFNNTVRQRQGMVVRKTLSFSRSLHNFVLFLLFFITKHNRAISHG
jgi:insertion element IS1 protein InsB